MSKNPAEFCWFLVYNRNNEFTDFTGRLAAVGKLAFVLRKRVFHAIFG